MGGRAGRRASPQAGSTCRQRAVAHVGRRARRPCPLRPRVELVLHPVQIRLEVPATEREHPVVGREGARPAERRPARRLVLDALQRRAEVASSRRLGSRRPSACSRSRRPRGARRCSRGGRTTPACRAAGGEQLVQLASYSRATPRPWRSEPSARREASAERWTERTMSSNSRNGGAACRVDVEQHHLLVEAAVDDDRAVLEASTRLTRCADGRFRRCRRRRRRS